MITFYTDNGPVTSALSLAGQTVATHSDLDGGVFFSVVGSGTAAGSFTINGVPGGNYTFQFGSNQYFTASQDFVDLKGSIMGRPGQTFAPASTMLTINATGLLPWNNNSSLALNCTNTGLGVNDISKLGAPIPDAGSTSAQFTFDYSTGGDTTLIQAGANDVLVLTQNGAIGGPTPYLTAVASATITGLTQLGGQASTINAAFTPLTLISQSLDWRTPQFEAYRADVNAAANTVISQGTITGVSGLTAANGVEGGTADLFFMPVTPGATPFSGTVTIGNPFGLGVPLAASFATYFRVMVQAPGAAAAPYYASISRSGPLSTFAGAILPTVSPVRTPTINGQAAGGALFGVGTTPVIKWTAPALGTPDRYLVAVLRLSNNAGQTGITFVGTIRTASTQVRIPPGMMTAGSTYVISVNSHVNGGLNAENVPFVKAGNSDFAEAVLGQVTP